MKKIILFSISMIISAHAVAETKNRDLFYGGIELQMSGKDGEACKIFTKLAERGFSEAYLNGGICYENGQGIKKDINKALRFYVKAANMGNVTALFLLSKIYEARGDKENREYWDNLYLEKVKGDKKRYK